jgi:hypothetical protein
MTNAFAINSNNNNAVCAFCGKNPGTRTQACGVCTMPYAYCGCPGTSTPTCLSCRDSQQPLQINVACNTAGRANRCCGCGKEHKIETLSPCLLCGRRRCTVCAQGNLCQLQQDEVTVTFGTWNMEKYGKRTGVKGRKHKQDGALKVLNENHPDLFVLQEVSRGGWFENDIKDRYLEYDVWFGSSAKTDDEYGLRLGPYFHAGSEKTYKEYYPLFYSRARVSTPPELYLLDTEEKDPKLDTPLADHFDSPFSTANDNPRKTPVWKVRLSTAPRSLRGQQAMFDRDILLAVVHTSPSLKSANTAVQSARVVELGRRLLKKYDLPLVLAGDWYAERLGYLDKLKNDPDFLVVIPPTQTNFPGEDKQGQVADHFIVSRKHWSCVTTPAWTVLPPDEAPKKSQKKKIQAEVKSGTLANVLQLDSSGELVLDEDDVMDVDYAPDPNEELDDDFELEDDAFFDEDLVFSTTTHTADALFDWTDIKVDHCPVFAMLTLRPPQQTNNNNGQ